MSPRSLDRPTYGVGTGLMAQRLGRPFMPWQQAAADLTGEVLPTGRLAFHTVVLKVPRQAGKTLLVLATLLQRCSIAPIQRCWYTAQDRQHASGMLMLSWAPIVDTSPAGSFVNVRRSVGSENLHLGNRSQVGIFTPDAEALHSQQADTVVCDEAWVHDLQTGADLEQAIKPAQLTRRFRQLWIVSAAGDDRSEWWEKWLTKARRAAMEERTSGICLIDYSAADTLDDLDGDVFDPALLRANHPAVGHTIDEATIQEDAADEGMSAADYARAYLGVEGGSRLAVTVVELVVWRALADEPDLGTGYLGSSIAGGRPAAIAADIAIDRSAGSVSVAGRRADGNWHVEVTDHHKGSDWMVGRLAELHDTWRAPIVVDDKGPSVTLAAALRKAKVPFHLPGTSGVTAAAGDLIDAIDNGTLRHRNQPVLNAAVRSATKRPIGDAFALGRKGSDVSPLTSVSFALWGAQNLRTVDLASQVN